MSTIELVSKVRELKELQTASHNAVDTASIQAAKTELNRAELVLMRLNNK